MAEKHTYIQIVDTKSRSIERIVELTEIDALSAEEKLALSRSKQLFIVTHRLEPIVRVEMKKTAISEPISFDNDTQPKPSEPEPAKTVVRKSGK